MSGDRYYRPIFTSDNWVELDEIVMAIDPSGRGQDETAYAVVGILKGVLYLVASGGLEGGYSEETLIQLARIAEKFKVHKVIPEDNFGGGMFTQLFKPVLFRYHKCEVVEEFRSKGQKEQRICDTLEPVIGSHRLVVLEDVIRKDFQPGNKDNQLFYQLTRITRQRGALKFDDRLDALAMAVSWFTERMNQEVLDTEAEHKRQLREEYLQKFLEACDAQTSWSSAGSEALLKLIKR
jgi:phage terminase large subunit-like protein